MTSLKIIAVSGSLRTDSFNRQSLLVAQSIVRDLGHDVSEIDLKQAALPIYDGDIEAKGFPEAVQKLRAQVEACDVLLIATPEYNYSVSSALKNFIDWLSRGGNAFKGKYAAIFGCSTGVFGSVRGQQHLRDILSAVNVTVLPQPQIFIGKADQAFAADGSLKDAKTHELLKTLISKTCETALARR